MPQCCLFAPPPLLHPYLTLVPTQKRTPNNPTVHPTLACCHVQALCFRSFLWLYLFVLVPFLWIFPCWLPAADCLSPLHPPQPMWTQQCGPTTIHVEAHEVVPHRVIPMRRLFSPWPRLLVIVMLLVILLPCNRLLLASCPCILIDQCGYISVVSTTCMTAFLLTICCMWFPSQVLFAIQLDCQSARRTRKNNLPMNQKGYDNCKPIVGKVSARRIQIFRVYFLWSFFDLLFFKTNENKARTKIYPKYLDLPRQIV